VAAALLGGGKAYGARQIVNNTPPPPPAVCSYIHICFNLFVVLPEAFMLNIVTRSSVVVKALCATSRKVAGSKPDEVNEFSQFI
jgi:hypothetical protein